MSKTPSNASSTTGISGRAVVLIGIALIGLVAIPFLLLGRGAERYVDLRSLRQMELSSWRVGSFHLSALEVAEIDRWPTSDAHAHIARVGLGTPLRARPSLYWQELGIEDEARPPLWHATYRLMPMAVIVRIENRHPMTAEARTQLDLRLVMVSVLDPDSEEDRQAYLRLDEDLAEGVRVIDPLRPPRGRVGYVAPVEGERLARDLLNRILDAAHTDPSNAAQRAREILLEAAAGEVGT